MLTDTQLRGLSLLSRLHSQPPAVHCAPQITLRQSEPPFEDLWRNSIHTVFAILNIFHSIRYTIPSLVHAPHHTHLEACSVQFLTGGTCLHHSHRFTTGFQFPCFCSVHEFTAISTRSILGQHLFLAEHIKESRVVILVHGFVQQSALAPGPCTQLGIASESLENSRHQPPADLKILKRLAEAHVTPHQDNQILLREARVPWHLHARLHVSLALDPLTQDVWSKHIHHD